MKKIIWISSYPKSGNTWIRYFLCNYFYNKNREDLDFSLLNYIDKFPNQNLLKQIALKESLESDSYSVCNYWIPIQSEIVKSNDKFIFLKNHNALVSLQGSELTNEKYSLGIIYVVRDPRDVAVSYSNFDRSLSLSNAIERITSNNLYCHVSKQNPFDIEILGSWKFNYLSWKNGVKNLPRIIIRYEDLVNNKFETKLKLINFLSELIGFKTDVDQINFSIKQSTFERLSLIEKTKRFHESRSKFFNSGKIGQWKDKLSSKQVNLIENFCKDEMRELQYL